MDRDGVEEGLLSDVEVQPILPLPNNYFGKRLLHSGLLSQDEVSPDWRWDFERLSRRYIDAFSNVSFDHVQKTVSQIRSFVSRCGISFGSGVTRLGS